MTEEEVYYEIRHASNEELLEAAIHFWQGYADNDYEAYQHEKWMRLGFALAQEDAWEKVAPAWLTDWRRHNKVPF